MNRFAEYIVFSGFRTAWRFASWPTRRSPVFVKATTDGVRRLPSLFVITVGLPPSITATTEFVVPRSIPTAFAIAVPPDVRIIERRTRTHRREVFRSHMAQNSPYR